MTPRKIKFPRMGALKVILPEYRSVTIALAGCGGTGGWVAPGIARIGRLLRELGKDVRLVFIDPDKVEPKNVFRQNFSDAEAALGINKAVSLAARYSSMWGGEIKAVPKTIGHAWNIYSDINVFIGCLDDSNNGRRELLDMVNRSSIAYAIDSGNALSYGQVLFGGKLPKKVLEEQQIYKYPGYVTHLPPPYVHAPELLKEAAPSIIDDETINQMSCAELALINAQGLSINQMMASIVLDYLNRLLVTQDLDKYATFVDLNSGSMRSEYTTKENVDGAIKKMIKMRMHLRQ